MRTHCLLLLSLALVLWAGPTWAATYEVGPGKQYATLEALRTDTARPAWADGDVIQLYADDASLTAAFNFGANTVSLLSGDGGAHVLTPAAGAATRLVFDSATAGTAFTLGAGLTATGFQAANGNGGAIHARGAVTANSATFAANSATAGSGGAIYAGDEVTANGATFAANSAGNYSLGGAIRAVDEVTANSATFAANSTGNYGDGGAISAGGGVTANSATFAANSTGSNAAGGAIYAQGGVTANSATFAANSTGSASGGAIYAQGVVTADGATFAANSAGGSGGAIFTRAGANLGAAAGQVSVFAGNTAGGSPNSVYFNNPGTLSVAGAGDLMMLDPLGSSSSNFALTVNKTGAGLWRLAGASVFNNTGVGGTAFTLGDGVSPGGVLALTGDPAAFTLATITTTAGGAASAFTVKSGATLGLLLGRLNLSGAFTLESGATLLAAGLGNLITTSGGTQTFETGATLALHAAGLTSGGITPVLSVTVVSGGLGAVNVDLQSLPGAMAAGGSYLLVGNTGAASFAPAYTPTLRGQTLADTRAAGLTVERSAATTELLLKTPAAIGNGTATWTGAADTKWDATSGNWNLTGVTDPQNRFLHGDEAVFSGAAGTDYAVTIQDGGVYVADRSSAADQVAMTVSGGSWIFTGGAIESTPTAILQIGDSGAASGGEVTTGVTFGHDHGFTSRQMRQHIRVPDYNHVTLAAADGATLNFVKLAAPANPAPEDNSGGAIWAGNGSTLTLGRANGTGRYNFIANTAGVGGAIAGGGSVSLGGGTYAFTANTAGVGGAIYGGGTVTLGGGTYAFTANTANGGHGGAIAGGGSVSLGGGTYAFTANTANGSHGGAIFGNTVNLDGGTYAFTANTAAIDGGAIAGGTVSLDGGTYAFTANTATGGGGAIAGGTVSLLGGTYAFTANTATGGGAILGNTVSLDGGTYAFTANTAVGGPNDHGGAIAGANVTLDGGTYAFTANTATGGGNGGAIYANQGASLTADGGDITFRGNTANSLPNALYINNFGSTNSLTLAAAGANRIAFYDPVASNGANSTLPININPDAAHTGTVLFDRYASGLTGQTTVHNGTMALTNGAGYGSANAAARFTLKSGATLSADARGNQVQAAAVTVETGHKLRFNMAGAVKAGGAGETTNLAFTGVGMSAFTGQVGNGAVYIDNFDPAGAAVGDTYTLVNTGEAGRAMSGGDLYMGGAAAMPVRSAAAGSKMTGLAVDVTAQYLQLKTVAADGAAILVWTGANSADWDTGQTAASANWRGGVNGVGVKTYLDGDTVAFDIFGANPNVTVAAAGVAPAAMTVTSGAYTFSGGAVSAGTLGVFGTATFDATAPVAVTGAATVGAGDRLGLTVGASPALTAGTMNFNNTGQLDISGYTGGNDYLNTQTLITTTGGVSNFDPNTVTVAGQSTTDFLAATAALTGGNKDVSVTTGLRWYSTDVNRKALGDFTVADGHTFTLGTVLADNTVNLDPAWNGRSLTKKGGGTLALTADNTATGLLDHQAGGLDLFKWGGAYQGATGLALNLRDQGGIAGAADFSGLTVSVAGAGVGSGTLGSAVFDNSVLNVDLGAGHTSDRLTVTGTAAFTGSNALNINNWLRGSYTLLTAGTLSLNLADLAWNQPASPRLSATAGVSGQSLILDVTIRNAAMTWTGAVNDIWDTATANWSGAGDTVFFGGDLAVFDGQAPGEVGLAADITAGGLQISGSGDYELTGGFTLTGAATPGLAGSDGGLAKGGPGTFRLANTRTTLAGPVTVTGGTLGLEREVSAASVTVGGGSTLAFYAKLQDDVLSTTAGLAAGAITVQGALAAEVDLFGTNTIDQESNAVTVATAANTLDLTGATLTGRRTMYDYAFTGSGNDLQLTVTPKQNVFFGDLAVAPNTRSMGRALDAARRNGTLPASGPLVDLLNAVASSSSAAEAQRLLNDANGTVLAAGPEVSRQVATLVRDWAMRWAGQPLGLDDSTDGGLSAPPAGEGEGRLWRLHVEGAGAWGRQDGESGDAGYDQTTWQGAAALDRRFENLRLGAAFSAGHAKLDWTNSAETAADTLAWALYGRYESGPWSVFAVAHMGQADTSSRRHPLPGLTARADYTGKWTGVSLGGAYDFTADGWELTPRLAAHYLNLRTPAIDERGAGNLGLHLDKSSGDSLELEAGIRLARPTETSPAVTVTPYLDLGVSVETMDRRTNFITSFQGAPGVPSFVTESPDLGRTAFNLGTGVEVGIDESVAAYVDYRGQFRENWTEHQGGAGLKISW